MFSYDQVGGVPTLFYYLASNLFVKHISYGLIANLESEVYRLVESVNPNVKFVKYHILNHDYIAKNFTSEDVIIITYFDEKLELFKRVNPKVFFWNVFPDTLLMSSQIRGSFFNFWGLKKLLKYLINEHGLVLMDGTAATLLNRILSSSFNFKFIPLPISVPEGNIFRSNKNLGKNNLKIYFIGRNEIWKIIPLKKIIYDLNYIYENHSADFELCIISDNKNLLISKLDLDIKFNFKIIENLHRKELISEIKNNAGLLISMGYSLLEASRFGIPSLIIDGSYVEFNSAYKYHWLFETENFILGNVFRKQEIKNTGSYLLEIMNKFKNSDEIKKISEQCYKYTKINHDEKKVIENFLNELKKCNTTVRGVIKNVFCFSTAYKIKMQLKYLYER